MFTRSVLWAIALTALPAFGSAQLRRGSIQPVTSPTKDAGTYHLSTGTWTRGVAALALAGPQVLYENTCTSGFVFSAPSGSVIVDSGRIPSPSSPTNADSLTGLYTQYEVNGFQIAYCTSVGPSTSVDVGFADCYAACDAGGDLPVPIAVFHLTNLPAGPGGGGMGCWLVNIDLQNTTLTFDLGGDCNGNYDGVASTDSFAWTWTEVSVTSASTGGLFMAGDPGGLSQGGGQSCALGTTFPGGGGGLGGANGIGIIDQFELGGGSITPGCYWFGGHSAQNPFSSFFMILRGDQASSPAANTGSAYCAGAQCPCGNDGSGGSGCRNSGLYGARLTATGSAAMAAGTDSLQFHVTGVNGSRPGLLLRGDNQRNGGAGILVGDGRICTTGTSQRSQVLMSSAVGTVHFDSWNNQAFGSVATVGTPVNFQYWYSDPVGSPCGGGFNFSNAWTVTYIP